MKVSVRSAGLCSAVLTFILIMPVAVAAQGTPKKPTSKPDDSRRQMQLRFSLQADPHDKKAHEELVKLLQAKNAFRSELEEDGTWLRNNPDDYETEIRMRALATAAVNDPEYAIAIDRFILAHANRADDPKDYDFVSERLAFALLDRNRNTEALNLLVRSTTENPNDSGVWEDLADAQVRIGREKEALASYQKSIDLDGTQEFPHAGMAKAFFSLGRYADAESELKAALSIYNAQYHGVPTDTFHSAMRDIQKATHMEPGLADLHRQLAGVYVAERKYDKALAEADAAAQANPNDAITYEYLRAAIYDHAAQPEKARLTRLRASREVQAEMKKGPRGPEMDANLAYPQAVFMSIEADDDDSAHEVVTLLEPLASGGTLKAMDLSTLGFAYCTLGRAADCERYVEAAFRANGKLNNAHAHHNLAEALLKAHDQVGAVEHFRQAYELDPENVTYRMDYESMRQRAGEAQSR